MNLAVHGDYENSDRFSSVNLGRYLFLKAVDKYVPEVRRDLIEGEPCRLFEGLPDEVSASLTWPSLARSQRNSPLTRALIAWAKRWHLEEGWCIAQALHVLQLWNSPQADEEGIEVGWSSPVSLATITTDEEMRFSFEHRGGDLAIQTRGEIADKIRKAFEKKLKSYLDGLESIAQERGYQPVIKKANRNHFEMLVRYQVQGWTHEEIAEKYHYKDGSNVAHIIPKTAKLIGLTLQHRQGRPRLKTT